VTEQPPSSEPDTRVQAPAAAPAESAAAGAEPGRPEPAPPAADSSASVPSEAENPGSGPAALLDEHPEIGVGAAFAGGFALAMILKRFGH
jgi:hypothetical protein